MQLDDVGELRTLASSEGRLITDTVSSLTTGPRVEEAMHRSVRWLDRCIAAHTQSGKQSRQNLFAIVQGGLDAKLRDKCLDEMILRKDELGGYAIGGLSGGEEKGARRLSSFYPPKSDTLLRVDIFWKM